MTDRLVSRRCYRVHAYGVPKLRRTPQAGDEDPGRNARPAPTGTLARDARVDQHRRRPPDGSIIAAIIVTQTPRYQPSEPRFVPGPVSIPPIRAIVTIQVASAALSSNEATPRGLARRRVRRPLSDARSVGAASGVVAAIVSIG